MHRANGFSLIELLVVIAIIAILAGTLFPVLAKSRAKGRQAACQSNLRQIGMALGLYRADHDGINCCFRQCAVADPEPTGFYPPDIWWAPYDPSVPPDGAPGFNWQPGLLDPYVKNSAIFKCPADTRWQCGYAMSYVNGSPTAVWTPQGVRGMADSLVTGPAGRVVVWDHCRTPGCAGATVPGNHPHPPFTPFAGAAESVLHYPPRHLGGTNFLFYDGHVKRRQPSALEVRLFREPGSAPPVPGYPGQ